MVKKINENLMNVGNLISIDGVVIHNDAGSGTPEWYVEWLRRRQKSLGIAHYYINKDTIARVIDTNLIGYHTGDYNSNIRYIGYEVCQSMSANDKDFIANEDMTLMQATEDLLYYGLPINQQTVRLHHEFVPTSCPHRSMALHGNTTQSVKDYFLTRMRYFASIGKTVDEMLLNNNKKELQETILKGEEDMAILISAKNRGIALMQGGKFLPILDVQDVPKLENVTGKKVVDLSQKTFDEFQNKGK